MRSRYSTKNINTKHAFTNINYATPQKETKMYPKPFLEQNPKTQSSIYAGAGIEYPSPRLRLRELSEASLVIGPSVRARTDDPLTEEE